MANIKLFVCSHQAEYVPPHPILTPIQAGAALADTHFPHFLHDDVGENISHKNRSYCELTAQYWAWKNMDADYYGFFHYRRYLYPQLNAKLPYRIEKSPTEPLLEQLGYNTFGQIIAQYDLILPKGENMYVSVRQHYADAPYHHRKDLDVVEQIIFERYPEYVSAMEQYLSGTICYFGNIFIMKRELFYHYCSWLFTILEEFDRRTDTKLYSPQEKRVNGYLAERLFGLYYIRTKRENVVSCELPRVDFIPDAVKYSGSKIKNMLLPAGSYRRAVVKKFLFQVLKLRLH